MDRQVDSLQTSKNFKKTEIGEIPVDWEVVKIAVLFRLGYGKGLIEEMREKGKFPVVGSNGIVGYHNRYCVKGPGIVIGRKGTIGAVTWVEPDFWPIDTTYYIELIKKDMSKRWLYYKLTSLNLEKLNMATGIPGLNRNIVYSSLIGIPSLEEQRKIAEILTTVDEAIEKSDAVIEKTKQLKKGLMQELLTRGIGHKKFKKTEIGEIPVDWEVAKLCRILKRFVNGYAFSSSDWVEKGIGVIRMSNISIEGKFQVTENNTKYIAEETTTNIGNNFILEKGDLIIAMTDVSPDLNIVGRTAIVSNNGYYLNQRVGKLIINYELVDTFFLNYLTNHENFLKQIKRNVSGSAQFNSSTKDICNAIIPLPTLFEQKKIAEILITVDEEIDKAVENREKLNTIKKGLMQVLLTGRVRAEV